MSEFESVEAGGCAPPVVIRKNDLRGQPGELHITLQIKRKATGAVETVQLVGKVTGEEDVSHP